MGNQVFAGAPFADVAKAGSDGFEANKGGQMAWTNQGALACQAIDMALFNLPVGQLSPIIESDRGFHIIRVTKREGDLVKPFLEAQVEIKKKIVDERSAKQAEDYMAKLLARTPVSTDSDINNPQLATPAGPGQPLRR
jgi:parvulin-like peptidyl-prolyl isomerase